MVSVAIEAKPTCRSPAMSNSPHGCFAVQFIEAVASINKESTKRLIVAIISGRICQQGVIVLQSLDQTIQNRLSRRRRSLVVTRVVSVSGELVSIGLRVPLTFDSMESAFDAGRQACAKIAGSTWLDVCPVGLARPTDPIWRQCRTATSLRPHLVA